MVRLASMMPKNSDWGRTMDRIAAEWKRVTNGEVVLSVIHDGVEGGESKMISSMSTNSIQGALLTSLGLAEIIPSIMTLSAPFLIQGDDELNAVMREIEPVLEDQISKTNYAMIAWSKAGWVNIFSKDPVKTPEDLRRQKLATMSGAGSMNLTFSSMGFPLVEIEITDISLKVANNVISAIYQSPAAVAPLGVHRYLKNMLDYPISPFLGGVVVNSVTWNRIKPEHQRELIRVTRRVAAEFDTAMPQLVANAVSMMRQGGLTVNSITPAEKAQWSALVNSAIPTLLDKAYDPDLYRRITGVLEKSKAGKN